jgi:hypothetical protein
MDAATWVVWMSMSMGAASGHEGSAAVGHVGAYRPLASWVAIEGQAGEGGVMGLARPGHGMHIGHFALGARLGPQRTSMPVRPFLWLAASHAHETPFSDIESDPMATAIGDSSAGVHHRSGGEAGLGVTFGIPRANGRLGQHLTVDVRATAVHLVGMHATQSSGHEHHAGPDHGGNGPRTWVYGGVAVGYRF